ncbi:asparagine synthetase AsnA [Spiroplasma clarkii]|uniref:Asparagine synthetase AsnA n=1 Tax=Spiroplasma clarkii TaxID=2139 RepID=A0A1Y0KYU3_9MOLU|nr:hypothetical protein [Spiroplasma clarkii]ARU90906.1 asparagine synthetase AsnA [Spiroplasma clarkii]ATX70356.1 asparagine synthetase AsnA [Spiroplasma clarkii]
MKHGITLGYISKLTPKETIMGIDFVVSNLRGKIKSTFNLLEIPSAAITDRQLWLNDDAQGTKRVIDFDNKSIDGYGEVIQSNNKWRRYFLYKNDFTEDGSGILTNMTVIERDVKVDNSSSISYEEMGIEIVKDKKDDKEIVEVASKIFSTIFEIDNECSKMFPTLEKNHFGSTLTFVTYKKLKELYPLISFKDRLNRFAKDNGSFVIQDYIEKTNSQNSTQQFSSDVFDFKSYAKIYYYNKSCEKVISAGYVAYQVDRDTYKNQNTILKESQKSETIYNHLIKSDQLPLTLTCGIYVNRIMMGFLEKQHIAEVYPSIWSQEFVDYCNTNNINIL